MADAARPVPGAGVHAGSRAHARVSTLVGLGALVGRMRILSSPRIVHTADAVVRTIIETYRRPNKTLGDVVEILDNETLNPLRDFSIACREELRPESL
jgi:hypothetical protein